MAPYQNYETVFFYEKVQLLYFQKIYLQIVLNSMHIMDRVLTNGFTQATVQVNLVLFPLFLLNSHFSFKTFLSW